MKMMPPRVPSERGLSDDMVYDARAMVAERRGYDPRRARGAAPTPDGTAADERAGPAGGESTTAATADYISASPTGSFDA
jgi:hypothetical protein